MLLSYPYRQWIQDKGVDLDLDLYYAIYLMSAEWIERNFF